MKRGKKSSLLQSGQGNGNLLSFILVFSCGFQGLDVAAYATPGS